MTMKNVLEIHSFVPLLYKLYTADITTVGFCSNEVIARVMRLKFCYYSRENINVRHMLPWVIVPLNRRKVLFFLWRSLLGRKVISRLSLDWFYFHFRLDFMDMFLLFIWAAFHGYLYVLYDEITCQQLIIWSKLNIEFICCRFICLTLSMIIEIR